MRQRDAWLVRKTDRWVDGIIANCQYLRQSLLSDNVPPELIEVCSNGVDLSEFTPASAAPRLWVGAVSVLRPEKDLPILIEAFARIRSRFPTARLRIVGSGLLREALARQAEVCGIDDAFELVSGTPQTASHFQKLGIFVSPSRSEGMSNSLLEAMACGCAVVASRAGAAAEIIRHTENGLLFDIGATDQLASILEMLLTDEGLCQRLGQAAFHTVRERFSADEAVKQLQKIYLSRLASSSSSEPH